MAQEGVPKIESVKEDIQADLDFLARFKDPSTKEEHKSAYGKSFK